MESLNQKYGVINYDNGVEFWFELEMSERGMQNERAGKSGENRAETV